MVIDEMSDALACLVAVKHRAEEFCDLIEEDAEPESIEYRRALNALQQAITTCEEL